MNRNERIILCTLGALLISLSQRSIAQSWSVDDCMRYAIIHHPKSKIQQLNRDDARKDLIESKLKFLPSINAGSSLSVNFGRSIDPATNIYDNTSNLSNNYSVSAGLTLFDGLYSINRYRIAKVIQQRETLVSKQIEADISIETMQAYYQVLFSQAALQIGREQIEENKYRYHKGQKEFEVGLRNISELALLKSNLVKAEYHVIVQEADYHKAMLDLKQKMNLPSEHSLELESIDRTSMHIGDQQTIDSLQIMQQALANLPDVQIENNAVQIASLEHQTAIGNLFPRLSLNGGISTSYSRFLTGGKSFNESLFVKQINDRLGEYIGLSLSIPIFDAFSRQFNVKRKKNAWIRSQIDRETNIKTLEKNIAEAIIQMNSIKKQCELSDENLQSNTLAYRTTEAKYNEGLVGIIDLLTVQSQFINAQIDRIKAHLNFTMQQRIINYYRGKSLIQNP